MCKLNFYINTTLDMVKIFDYIIEYYHTIQIYL